MVYTISQIACIEMEWPPFMQWHRIWLAPSYIDYIAMTTAVPFNTGHPSAVSRSLQLKAALQVFSHYKVPLTFRYTWKRLRKRRSKNLIEFPQVYIAFVLHYVHCFEKKNSYWLNESWETRLLRAATDESQKTRNKKQNGLAHSRFIVCVTPKKKTLLDSRIKF